MGISVSYDSPVISKNSNPAIVIGHTNTVIHDQENYVVCVGVNETLVIPALDGRTITASADSLVNFSGGAQGPQGIKGDQGSGVSLEDKDAMDGYAGLTLFKINFKNAANTFTNFLTNATTAARTYTFPDKDITVAGLVDITGVNSGTNTGDNAVNSLYSGLVSNATHTGEVTGSTALTIANSAVTLAKMANMASASLIYRKTAGAGAPEVNTLATLKADLALVKADVGLGNVDNTADSTKPVSTAQQTALDLKQNTSGKDATGGYAGLTLFKINFKNAANTFTNFLTNATTAARTYTFPDKDITVAGLVDITGVNSGTNTGDNAVNSLYSGLVSNATHTGEVTGSTALTIANSAVTLAKMANMATASLIYRKTAGAGAPEVNTLATLKTDLALTKTDVGLANVDNTTDAGKPVSTAQQTALDLKQNTSGKDATGGYSGLTLFKINFKNAANTFTNFLANATTAARTYTFPDKDITVAGLVDITGVNSGTNTGDNAVNSLYSGLVTNATHTGDVTGSAALTIANSAVTLAKMANMATASLIYRRTAGTGVPEVNTLATLKTDLALAKADVGLGSVDNTADTAKPVSTAQQTALNLKANLVSPSFTTPALGTPASGTLTNCTFPTLNQSTTGSAASCTGNAETVTTNANLTGPITSVGNATSIASQTGTGTKFVMATLPQITTAMGIDVASISRLKLYISGDVTGSGGGNGYGVLTSPTINSDIAVYSGFYSAPLTEATAFTVGSLFHFRALQGTIGAGSAITNQYGFMADANLVDATNNYGFYGNIPTGAGQYNLYMGGTAPNYLAGTLQANSSLGVGISPSATAGDLSVKEQILSTCTYSAVTGAGNLALNSATGNRIDFSAIGYAPPAYTTRSTGTKICLWPSVAAAAVDYAIGIDANTLWTSVPVATVSFKWYAGTDLAGTLSGTGDFTAVGNVAGVDLAASRSVGIGAVTPGTFDLTFGGQVNRFIAAERQTTANTAGTHLYLTASGATASATDKAGGTLVLRSGLSTGAGTSDVYIQTSTNGAASTADNTYITAFRASNNKIGFFGVTPVVRPTALTATVAAAPTTAGAFGWGSAADKITATTLINTLKTRVDELETKLKAVGLLT